MVNIKIARNLLLTSLHDLENKQFNLSEDDYAADIINVTCQYFLDNCTNYKSGTTAMLFFQHNYIALHTDVSTFVSSISGDYPELLTMGNIQNLTQNICLNLGWDEMRSFLADYFYKKHGQICSIDDEHYEFSSTNHTRYENRRCVSKSTVDRQISVSFKNQRKKISVTITPSLTLKTGTLKEKKDDIIVYTGTDPDYQFEVQFDTYDDIVFFALELKSRNIRIEYFE